MYRVLLVACVACGDSSTGTYRASWSLTDSGASSAPTCASYKIARVELGVTVDSGDEFEANFECDAGSGTLDVPIGEHQITIFAVGSAGDIAGRVESTHSLADGQFVTLDPVTIDVAPPVTMTHTTWNLRRAGHAATCADFPTSGVSVTTMTPDDMVVDLWDCTETNATVDVPYNEYIVTVDLLGANSVVLGSSSVGVAAGRGVIEVETTIEPN